MSQFDQNHKDAKAKLEVALMEYLDEVGYEGLLIDWMLVAAQHIPHSDGSSGTALSIHVQSHQSVYRSLGLAQYAVHKTNRALDNTEDEDT